MRNHANFDADSGVVFSALLGKRASSLGPSSLSFGEKVLFPSSSFYHIIGKHFPLIPSPPESVKRVPGKEGARRTDIHKGAWHTR
ncbi:MAG: hypothetical protein CVV55_07310 [Synergistetes bacterium HGW-Synergistetes-2]|nr:MAG: hypothetical protein CVV55_07310 [Synergistetes bacterium HGW-Synergistetes-2]